MAKDDDKDDDDDEEDDAEDEEDGELAMKDPRARRCRSRHRWTPAQPGRRPHSSRRKTHRRSKREHMVGSSPGRHIFMCPCASEAGVVSSKAGESTEESTLHLVLDHKPMESAASPSGCSLLSRHVLMLRRVEAEE